MNDEDAVRVLFDRQAVWQQRRAALPWEEKLRQSLVMRAARQSLRMDFVVTARTSEPAVYLPVRGRGD